MEELGLFAEYPEGYDLTILQTLYAKATKMDNGKYSKPSLTIVAKDNNTNEKVACQISDPNYIWFLAKNPDELEYHHDYLEREKLQAMLCKYSELEKDIAKATGNEKFFKHNLMSGQYKENAKLHTLNQVFFSDQNIEDHYRFWFNRTFKNRIITPTKGYLDIEVDVSDIAGDFPEPGEAPINAVTYIFNGTINTYILRNPSNPLISKFENDVVSGEIDRKLNELLEYAIGSKERMQKFKVDGLVFRPKFFNEEIHLLKALFDQINTEQPDFIMAWNMAFDIPYIIERIKVLGYTPESIMCHEDFYLNPKAYYFIDERMENSYAERGDYAYISSYTVYLDQMIQFASRRKGQSAFISFKLNDIGNVICGVKKLDYHHITTDIGKLPYLDFETFIFYNIVDVIVQVCIEESTDDIGYIYNSSILNNTRFPKVHRQTIYLRNKQADFYYNLGLVVGNNINKTREKPKEKFDGAFVADPNLVNDSAKVKINGIPVFLCDNLVDFDFSSLYPSINREFNLSAPSEIGMIQFEDGDKNTSSAFIEDFASHDYLTFASRWLGMPDYNELCNEVINLFGSGRLQTELEFKVYDKGILVKPEVVENTEYINAITKRQSTPVRALVTYKDMPEVKNDII